MCWSSGFWEVVYQPLTSAAILILNNTQAAEFFVHCQAQSKLAKAIYAAFPCRNGQHPELMHEVLVSHFKYRHTFIQEHIHYDKGHVLFGCSTERQNTAARSSGFS